VKNSQEAIMAAQASSWTGWHAIPRPQHFGRHQGMPQARALPQNPMTPAPTLPVASPSGPLSALSAHAADVLLELGAPTAADMHALGEGIGGVWSLADWYTHIREEETKLFPVLLHVADTLHDQEANQLRDTVMKLVADHTFVRVNYLDIGNLPPPALAVPHGHMEDELIARYTDQIRRFRASQAPQAAGGSAATGRYGRARSGQTPQEDPRASSEARMVFGRGPGAMVGAPGDDDPTFLALTAITHISYEDYLRAKGDVAIPEKFRDPRTDGSDPTCSKTDSGTFDYLYAIPTAAEGPLARSLIRVNRIRQKVEDFGTFNAKKKPSISMMWRASQDQLITNISDVVGGYQTVASGIATAKQIQEFADKIGSTADAVVAQANSVLASLASTGFSPSIAVTADPIRADAINAVKVVWAAIGPQVMGMIRSVTDEFSKAAAAAKEVSDASAAVPVFGAFLKLALDMFSAAEATADKSYYDACAGFMDSAIKSPLEILMKEGYPYPWPVLDISYDCGSRGTLGPSKWVPTAEQDAARLSIKKTLEQFDAIDPVGNAIWVTSVRRWWALASQMMAYGDMAAIFGSLDGLVASDEQVLLVAAPIAASYGLPIWDFAKTLYDYSLGWHDPSVAALLKPEPYNVCALDATTAPEGGCLRCKTAPANAATVQWGVLARDAFMLAEKAKRGEVPGVVPSVANYGAQSVPPPSPKSKTPLIWGGIGVGVAALASAPAWIVATPAVVSALYFWLHRPTTEQGTPPPVPASPRMSMFTGIAVPTSISSTLESRLRVLM
jgi:hypothetical protein